MWSVLLESNNSDFDETINGSYYPDSYFNFHDKTNFPVFYVSAFDTISTSIKSGQSVDVTFSTNSSWTAIPSREKPDVIITKEMKDFISPGTYDGKFAFVIGETNISPNDSSIYYKLDVPIEIKVTK